MSSKTSSIVTAELPAVLKPLDNFLTALQQPGANTETVVQEFGKLQLAEIQNAPVEENIAIDVAAAHIQEKLRNLIPDLAK